MGVFLNTSMACLSYGMTISNLCFDVSLKLALIAGLTNSTTFLMAVSGFFTDVAEPVVTLAAEEQSSCD